MKGLEGLGTISDLPIGPLGLALKSEHQTFATAFRFSAIQTTFAVLIWLVILEKKTYRELIPRSHVLELVTKQAMLESS